MHLAQSLADRLVGSLSGVDRPVFSTSQPMQALAIGRCPAGVEMKKPFELTPVEEPKFAA